MSRPKKVSIKTHRWGKLLKEAHNDLIKCTIEIEKLEVSDGASLQALSQDNVANFRAKIVDSYHRVYLKTS